jgi:AcrR family transcriptional regulator
MARPKEFERETALRAAIKVFWAHGYEGTSTDTLLRAMKIGRQSMYDTFGGKRRLYLEALRQYNAERLTEVFRDFHSASSPLAGLEQALLAFASKAAEQRLLGCMGVNAICEFGQSDAEVALLNQSSGTTLTTALERLLRDAKAKGELGTSLDERAAAQFIISTLAGIKVSARAGASAQTLRSVASFAMQSLKAA